MSAPALAVLAPFALLDFLVAAIDEAETAPPLQSELAIPFRKALDRAKEATREARAALADAPGVAFAAYAQGNRARAASSLSMMGRRFMASAEAAIEKPNPFAVALAALNEAGELLTRGAVSAAQPAQAAAYGRAQTHQAAGCLGLGSPTRPRGRA